MGLSASVGDDLRSGAQRTRQPARFRGGVGSRSARLMAKWQDMPRAVSGLSCQPSATGMSAFACLRQRSLMRFLSAAIILALHDILGEAVSGLLDAELDVPWTAKTRTANPARSTTAKTATPARPPGRAAARSASAFPETATVPSRPKSCPGTAGTYPSWSPSSSPCTPAA